MGSSLPRLVVKRCPDARHQFEWLSRLHRPARPDKLRLWSDESAYQYEFVEGTYPADVMRVWEFAHQVLWTRHKTVMRVDKEAFVRYCVGRGCDPAVMNTIYRWRVTEVSMCHGDLTLGNVIQRADMPRQFTLIDPGHHRGLPCREAEEAKLFQSVDGWDRVRWGAPHVEVPRQLALTLFHTTLVYANYVRILRHDHPRAALDFAAQRAEELRTVLYERLGLRTTQAQRRLA